MGDIDYGRATTLDTWLSRNLGRQDGAAGTLVESLPTNDVDPVFGYRLRVLRLVLTIAAVATATMWYVEQRLGLIIPVDRAAYPLLLAVTSGGVLSLFLMPKSLHTVVATVLATFIGYLLVDYYYILAHQQLAGDKSSYSLATLALWLPLSYVASHVFFSPRAAVRTSIGIYLAISLPQWMLLGSESHSLSHQITIAMLVSHPVYIAALWGVAQLKTRAMGVHDFARDMCAAASEDPLTAIANRRALLQALGAVTNASFGRDRSVALLIFDVDRFKRVNDRFGHSVGDEVLIALTNKVKTDLRASDLLGRWGGEEFMIVSLDLTESQAMHLAERLREGIAEVSHTHVGAVTISIGVTIHIPDEDADTLVRRADNALYLAKDKGRNRVEGLFGPSGAVPSRRR